jgi:hypothetical protein
LGKNLKDIQLKLLEITVDEKLIKRTMDIIIKELLKSKEPNVDNLMQGINNEKLEFSEIQKNKLQEAFKDIFVNRKRIGPEGDVSQSKCKRVKLEPKVKGMGGSGGVGD